MKLFSKTAQHLKARKNTQASIQPAAIRHRVEMTPKNQSAIRITSKSRPRVSRGIIVVFYRKIFQLTPKPRPRLEPHRAPRNSLSPIRI